MFSRLSLLFLFLFVLLVYLPQNVVHSATIVSYENTESKEIPTVALLSPIESSINAAGLKSSLSSNAVVTVQVWLVHNYNANLIFYLYGPDGSDITLSYHRGWMYENVFDGTLFTDSASTSVTGVLTFLGNGVVSPLKPEEKLSYFRGKNPNGQWKLSVSNALAVGNGFLNGFTLNIQGFFFVLQS